MNYFHPLGLIENLILTIITADAYAAQRHVKAPGVFYNFRLQ